MKIISILIVAVSAIVLLPSFLYSSEEITITTYYPSPYGSYANLQVYGSVTFPTAQAGDTVSIYSNIQSGGTWLAIRGGADANDVIWIGGDGTPDNTTGTIVLSADKVHITGDLILDGSFPASTCQPYTLGTTTRCPANSYAIFCASGTCTNPTSVFYPPNSSCPQSGFMICLKHE